MSPPPGAAEKRFPRPSAPGSLLLSLALASVLCSCSSLPPPGAGGPGAAGVEGKVTYLGEPLAAARVEAYRSLNEYEREAPFALSAPVAESGDFSLQVPPGHYYITARGVAPDGEGTALFNFHGSNPVQVAPGGKTALRLSMTALPPPPRHVDEPGESAAAVEGIVRHRGEPLEGATVYLYLKDERGFRGTAYLLSPPTGPDGLFFLSGLVESSYYLVARKRAGGRTAGPLLPGDFYGFYPFNPLALTSGTVTEVAVEVIAKVEDSPALSPAATAVEGVIVDTGGRPLEGLYAFVYEDRIMSHSKPLAISEPTGRDGKFVLPLEKGGKYYLGAREDYGGNPRPGEYYGKYTGTADHSLSVTEGTVERGVRITVDRVLE